MNSKYTKNVFLNEETFKNLFLCGKNNECSKDLKADNYDDIPIYICTGYNGNTDFKWLEKYCSNERIKKAKEYKNNIDYGNCLISYYLLRYLLTSRINYIFSKNEHWIKDKYNKPHIKDLDIEFSLSHTSNAVVVAISKYPIGVDIEKDDNKDFSNSVKLFSNYEIIYLKNNPKKFKELWVKKEAYSKCLGSGLTKEILNLDFSLQKETLKFNDIRISSFKNKDYIIGVASKTIIKKTNIVHISYSELKGLL